MKTVPSPEQILDFTPPPAGTSNAMTRLATAYFNPYFTGLDQLNLKRPALWVGNHTLFGLTDVPLMVSHIHAQTGVMLRGLGDRGHFKVPYWGEQLVKAGMVLGTPEHCAALMQAGQHVLVFPGGGREVMRRKGEAYQLIWKKRTGFARLAIEHGYDIIPFASVGPDENYKILLDANEVSQSKLWNKLAEHVPLNEMTRNGDMIPPLVRGIGASWVPRPQRFYFAFGKRIRTSQLKRDSSDQDSVWALREKVAHTVEAEVAALKAYREADRKKNWGPLRRWLAPLQP